MAFSAVVCALVAAPDATALFFDTQNTFSAVRLGCMVSSAMGSAASEAEVEQVLRRVKVVACFNVWQIMDALDTVRREGEGTRMGGSSDTFYGKLVLIVIDSVSAVLSTLLTSSQNHGVYLMPSANITFSLITSYIDLTE